MENASVVPIRRNDALVTFSREHHFALLICWKIRQGIRHKIDAQRIGKYVLHFFDKELHRHFVDEETGLFVVLADEDPLKQRALSDHHSIYALINELEESKPDYIILNFFADALDKHIRFEERTLFNLIQEKLSPEELKEIALKHEERQYSPDDDWEDKFWITRKNK